jgi:hypothetical protein
MGGKRISDDVWELVRTAILLCLEEDGVVTSHNIEAFAQMHGADEVTQSRAYKMLLKMYMDGELDRYQTYGPTEYVFMWKKE